MKKSSASFLWSPHTMYVATCNGMSIEDSRQTADLQEPVLGVFG